MKKNEFKKMMKKENKTFKNYYVYEMILILLLVIIVIPNIILTINNMIPFNITIINALLMQNLFHSKNKFHLSALTNHIIVCKFGRSIQ